MSTGSLCSPSYEGLKVLVSHSTILEKLKIWNMHDLESENIEFDAETYLKRCGMKFPVEASNS